MANCAPMPTPLPLQVDKVLDQQVSHMQHTFKVLLVHLQYLTLTRSSIQYDVKLKNALSDLG